LYLYLNTFKVFDPKPVYSHDNVDNMVILVLFCIITDLFESSPPDVSHGTINCAISQDKPYDVTKNDIIMKIKKKQGGDNHVIDMKRLDQSVTQTVYLHVTGMSCTSHVNTIETNIVKKPGE